MKRRTYLIATILVVLAITPIAAFFGAMQWTARQRVADAERAFLPIIHLRPVILSQPIAFYRHCRYVVDFPPESQLTDSNISQIQSLNLLPERNTLDVTIRTRNVTDASVGILSSMKSCDLISVDDTAITDDGIEMLKSALGDAVVTRRRSN